MDLTWFYKSNNCKKTEFKRQCKGQTYKTQRSFCYDTSVTITNTNLTSNDYSDYVFSL